MFKPSLLKPLLSIAALLFLLACGGVQRPDGGQGLLPVGAEVPELSAPDQSGQQVALRKAQISVVYFYPRDGTPGCTKEACAFRDVWAQYTAANVRVIGVSSDSDARHRDFAKEHELTFSLVSDPEHVWSQAFGVSTVAGMDKRVSFLIDANGHIAKVYADVDPGVHASEVLRDAANLQAASKGD